MIRNRIIVILISLLLLGSCERDNTINPPCGSENPLEDIDWLKEIKKGFEMRMGIAGAQIIRYKYDGDYVFWIDPCYNCPDGLISIYNCEGEIICESGGIDGRDTCPFFHDTATDSTMLYNNVQN